VPLDDRGLAAALLFPAGGVLALDLSSVVGWAYGLMTSRMPNFGTWHLPKWGGEGGRYASFENELAAAMELYRPAHMILEATLPLHAMLNGKSNYVSVAQQFALRGIALSEAYRASCPWSSIDAMTVRREVIGTSRFRNTDGSKDDPKKHIVAACHKRGWKVPDHNAGDACLTWEWHRMRLTGVPPVAGPLWMAVA
jgi:hypothetical protein